MITVLSRSQAMARVAKSLSLSDAVVADPPFDAILAQAIRRAVNVMSPCAAHELVRAVSQTFSCYSDTEHAFTGRVSAIVDDLIVYGDILEMRSDEKSPDRTRSFILRPSPPSFVVRKDGSIVILGIAGDQVSPLTADLDVHVQYHGVLRIIRSAPEPDLASTLAEMGLFKLSEKAWLRLPNVESAQSHLANWRQLLGLEPPSAPIEGLNVLDTATSPHFYKGRWGEPRQSHSGLYVARRPQKYGSALWCLVELERGNVKRFKDLSAAGDRLRPVDIAWCIQAALDALAGTAQTFSLSPNGGPTVLLRFYSPLPSWCERYLSVTGERTKADQCLVAYEIPEAEASHACGFLQEMLWMIERTK
jgi:hypothetical protein